MCDNKNYLVYHGWRYYYNRGQDRLFHIEPSCPTDQYPESFYKYYPLNDNTVDALTNKYIYASHPYQLNDPFDCNGLLFKFTYEAIRKMFGDEYIKKFEALPVDTIQKEKIVQDYFLHNEFDKIGIFSLSENNHDLYFWSHYANNEGICIEYNINLFPFRYFGPFPMHYIDAGSLAPISINSDNIPFATLINTNIKTDLWKNEHEWRMLCPSEPGETLEIFTGNLSLQQAFDSHKKYRQTRRKRVFHYKDYKCINSITFGPKFFDLLSNNNNGKVCQVCIPRFISKNDKNNIKRTILSIVADYHIKSFGAAPQITHSLKACPLKIEHKRQCAMDYFWISSAEQ